LRYQGIIALKQIEIEKELQFSHVCAVFYQRTRHLDPSDAITVMLSSIKPHKSCSMKGDVCASVCNYQRTTLVSSVICVLYY